MARIKAHLSLRENELELQRINNELKFEKAKVQESEEKYRTMYEKTPLSYQSLDENGFFLDVNPMWLKTLGYKREEIIHHLILSANQFVVPP